MYDDNTYYDGDRANLRQADIEMLSSKMKESTRNKQEGDDDDTMQRSE